MVPGIRSDNGSAGRLARGLDIFATTPPSKGADSATYVERVVEIARWSEAAGCEGTLVYTDNSLVKVERRGRLVAHLVHDASGQPLGWYLYYLRPGWRSEVLQIVAAEPNVGRILDHLLSHAHRHGSAVVRGRLEPGLVEAVVRRRCLLWHRGGALAHSRDPALLCALQSDGSLATRLEGEWWSDAPL